MALVVIGASTCPICHVKIENRDFMATWGVFLPESDPLVGCCDGPIHWNCYARWSERPRFAKAHVDFWVEHTASNPYWGEVFRNDAVFVSMNPWLTPPLISIHLYETGTAVRLNGDEWNEWLHRTHPEEVGSDPLEQDALAEILPLLCRELPDTDAFRKRFDWEAKQYLQDKYQSEENARRKQQEQTARIHNHACQQLNRILKKKGMRCPHCARHSKTIRYLDLSYKNGKSYFICQECAHSFDPSDFPSEEI